MEVAFKKRIKELTEQLAYMERVFQKEMRTKDLKIAELVRERRNLLQRLR